MIHKYMDSIGFKQVKHNELLYDILGEVVANPDDEESIKDKDGNDFTCFTKNLDDNMGITVCGHYQADSEFYMDYYFPWFEGSSITTREKIDIERHRDKMCFSGLCDDAHLGISLIFCITNTMEALKESMKPKTGNRINGATLSGLAYEGRILLPVKKSAAQVAMRQKETTKRIQLIEEARKGNREAMENLTLSDMDTYTSVSRRIARKEDIYTIVESSIVPYGIESDQYIILGEIQDFKEVENPVTHETVVLMSLNCNGLIFDVCINKNDLYGEPEIGRRIKGQIWMQGYLNFNN